MLIVHRILPGRSPTLFSLHGRTLDAFLSNGMDQQETDDKSGGLPSEKKRGNDRHVKRCSPVNIDGRRKAKMAQNDQPIADRDENCNSEEYCGGAPVSPPEKTWHP